MLTVISTGDKVFFLLNVVHYFLRGLQTRSPCWILLAFPKSNIPHSHVFIKKKKKSILMI